MAVGPGGLDGRGWVILLVLCGGGITGGVLYHQARQADWLRLDGLPAPEQELRELASVPLRTGTRGRARRHGR